MCKTLQKCQARLRTNAFGNVPFYRRASVSNQTDSQPHGIQSTRWRLFCSHRRTQMNFHRNGLAYESLRTCLHCARSVICWKCLSFSVFCRCKCVGVVRFRFPKPTSCLLHSFLGLCLFHGNRPTNVCLAQVDWDVCGNATMQAISLTETDLVSYKYMAKVEIMWLKKFRYYVLFFRSFLIQCSPSAGAPAALCERVASKWECARLRLFGCANDGRQITELPTAKDMDIARCASSQSKWNNCVWYVCVQRNAAKHSELFNFSAVAVGWRNGGIISKSSATAIIIIIIKLSILCAQTEKVSHASNYSLQHSVNFRQCGMNTEWRTNYDDFNLR